MRSHDPVDCSSDCVVVFLLSEMMTMLGGLMILITQSVNDLFK